MMTEIENIVLVTNLSITYVCIYPRSFHFNLILYIIPTNKSFF